MTMKENKWLIVLIVCAVITSVGGAIGFFLDNDVTGEILSEEFLQILKMQKLAGTLKSCCGISIIFWMVAIGNYFYAYHNDFEERIMRKIFVAALLASAFVAIALIRTVPIATQKAEVRVGTVYDTDMRGGRVRSYTVEFEDGKKIGVSKDEYMRISEGDTFYTVYCGDTLIEILDMDDYRLPAELEK